MYTDLIKIIVYRIIPLIIHKAVEKFITFEAN